MLPPRPFLDAIVRRVLVLWLVLHGVSALGASVEGAPFIQSLLTPAIGTVWLIAVIVLAMRMEMGRRAELLFLANLGHSYRRIGFLIIGECLVLEAGLRMAVA